ncbi:MAG: aminopeptidase P family protein [Planctomycetia bacterium]|nr:aminopeptidase P family protein [Planctomycetia bacterium]
MNGVPVLDLAACRVRQARLRRVMAERSLDAVVVVTPEHVQYLTGHRWDFRFAPAAALTDAGAVLVCPDRPVEQAAAEEIRTYEAKWRSTLRTDQREASSAVLGDWLRSRGGIRRVGVEYSACPPHVTRLVDGVEYVDIEPDLLRLRRRKDADELELLRRAIGAAGAMVAKAREIVRPGVTELEVFSALQAAAVASCGEMLTGTGNDYACGVRGGPPRVRACAAGELYILDLGPSYRGYWADIARVIAVDGRPTDQQVAAWRHVCEALRIVERMARPGVRCRDLYEAAREWLAAAPVGSWSSHLGHGIGLFVHEGPHLNPHWDDTLEAGDVIAVEPALYAAELSAGLRLENDYLVTPDGVESLSPFPLDLDG